jgi:two-component system, sensor histidine kinase and response regulator
MRDLNETAALGNLFRILDESVSRLEKFSIIALKITQLKTGSYELDLQDIPLNLVLNKIHKHFHREINNKKLNWISASCESCNIWGDVELVSNALSSIYDNAIKFSPVNGEIETIIEVEEGKIAISVKDSGAGFSEQALRTLYKLFSPGVKHVNENEGIELAMVKMIMDIHKGEIKITNSEKGAVVTLVFPIHNVQN